MAQRNAFVPYPNLAQAERRYHCLISRNFASRPQFGVVSFNTRCRCSKATTAQGVHRNGRRRRTREGGMNELDALCHYFSQTLTVLAE